MTISNFGDTGGTGPGGTAGCSARILGAVNKTFGTSFTSANVQNIFTFNAAVNLVVSATLCLPGSSMPSAWGGIL